MSLMKKLQANTTLKHTNLLSDSKVFEKEFIQTHVPMINVALSGRINGGFSRGLTVLAGPSKHFKTSFALLMAGAFLREKPDGILMFFDSEFGAPKEYFEAFGIDPARVLHIPITTIEDLKFELAKQVENLTLKDDVFVLVDSVGNLASKKEVDDALAGSDKADMTRAKQLKSVFRMVTPHLTLKNIPMMVVNHTYSEMALHPRQIVSGGTGIYYSADTIWIVGRNQDKNTTSGEIDGYDFIINVEKSRFVNEKSKIPISVKKNGGIQTFSGLFEMAVEFGYITSPKKGWYLTVDPLTGEPTETNRRKADIATDGPFWRSLIKHTNFAADIQSKFELSNVMQSLPGEDEDGEVTDGGA